MPAPRRAPSNNNNNNSVLETLHAAAPERAVVSFIPVETYLRSAMNLERQADEYRKANNQEQRYLMLLRFVSLVAETIPKHPTLPKSDSTYRRLFASLGPKMSELERLKLEIKLTSQAELERAPYAPTLAPNAVRFGTGRVPEQLGAADAAALDQLGTPGWATMQQQMASAPRPPPPPGGSQPLSSASFLIPDIPALTPGLLLPQASSSTLSKHALMPPPVASRPRPPSSDAAAANSGAPPPPPPPPSYADLLAALGSSGNGAAAAAFDFAPPMPDPYALELPLGPQEVQVQSRPHPTGPPIPGDTCCQPSNATGPPPPTPPPPQSAVSASTAVAVPPPSGGVAEVTKRQRIRDVHISMALMKDFLRYADSNTRRGIETCGILAGRLSPDDARFTVTALIVPKQEGTSDTVHALAEEEIFEAQDSRALYPLGWIHTHPTQSCFLSSVDVHTQCGYQTMLDEAIAIVMAPREPRNQMGVFQLTSPGGLSLVQQCPRRGFHAHPPTTTGQPIYEECSNVYLNERAGYEVIDLRGI